MEEKNHRQHIRDVLEVVVWTLILALGIRTFVFEVFKVSGNAMGPAFNTGERLIIDKLFFHVFKSKLSQGDVIVFRYPSEDGKNYIRRVVAVPGDTVESDGNSLFINGEKLKEHYAKQKNLKFGKFRYKLSKEEVFVLGDDRRNSIDSRKWGPIDSNSILGKVWVKIWPFTR